MRNIIEKMKGVSCILTHLSLGDATSCYEWTSEMMYVLDNVLKECIVELEKYEYFDFEN